MAVRDDVSAIIQGMEDAARKAGKAAVDGSYVAVTYDVDRGKVIVSAQDGADGARDLAEVKRRARAKGYTVTDHGRRAVTVAGQRFAS